MTDYLEGADALQVPDGVFPGMDEDELTNALLEAMSLAIDLDYKPTPYTCGFQGETLRADTEATDT